MLPAFFTRLSQPTETPADKLAEVVVLFVLVEYLLAGEAQALGIKVDDYLHLQFVQEALGRLVLVGVGS